MAIDGGLRRLFRQRFPEFHWCSVETGSTGLGIPDSNACYQGLEFWVEYKLAEANAVGIEPEQVGWAEQRIRAGGRVYLAVRRRATAGPRRLMRDELYLYPGTLTRAVKVDGLRTPTLDFWTGGPGRWDWGAIRSVLLTR